MTTGGGRANEEKVEGFWVGRRNASVMKFRNCERVKMSLRSLPLLRIGQMILSSGILLLLTERQAKDADGEEILFLFDGSSFIFQFIDFGECMLRVILNAVHPVLNGFQLVESFVHFCIGGIRIGNQILERLFD